MITVNVNDFTLNAAKYIADVRNGQEIMISENDNYIAQVEPIAKSQNGKRPFGLAKGEIIIVEDFDAPLPEEIISDFYGK